MKNFLKILSLPLLLAILISSCKKGEYSVVTDGIYLAEATSSTSKKVTIDEKGATVSVTPRMIQKAIANVKAKIVVDTLALKAFNKKYGTNYMPVPDSIIKLLSDTVNIQEGQVSGTPIKVSLKPFSEEMSNSGNKYALALALKDVNGTTLLTDLAKYIFEFDQVIVTSVPILNKSTAIKMAMRQDYQIKTWSVEMRVNMDKLGTNIGQYNNQAIFGAWGNGSEIYARFGDAPIAGNVLQVKHQGTQINSNTKFQPNKWYHVAFVCDGSSLKLYVNGILDGSLTVPGQMVNLSKTDFHMVSSGSYFVANCMLSEVRFWTIPISENQIKNNMFAINPKTEGLEAYWKMNEGTGNIFKDATGHENTAATTGNVSWKSGVRSDE